MSEVTKRRGRPSKGDSMESQRTYPKENTNQENNIEMDIPNNIDEEQLRHDSSESNNQPENDEDLKQFLKKPKKSSKKVDDNDFGNEQNDIDEQTLQEIEDFEQKEGLNDIPSDDFNPLEEPVKERAYTSGMNQNNQSGEKVAYKQEAERIIEEPSHNINSTSNKLDVDDNLINPTNDIPNDNGGGNGGNGNNNNGGDKKSDGGSGSSGNNNSGGGNSEKKEKEKVGTDNVKELSTKEKKDAIDKTADAILLAYQQYIPLPFIYFSSYDAKKLERLHDNDEIDLGTKMKDGGTFRQYASKFNDNVETAFVVTDAEVEALKEPLVDVLMEQDFAFTPVQRLAFVAGQFIVAKVMICVKFLREKKSDMDSMREIHKENMEMQEKLYQQREAIRKANMTTTKPQQNNQAQAPKVTVVEKKEEVKPEPNNTKNSDDTSAGVISDANIVSETKNDEIEKTPTLDDVLNMDGDEVEEKETNDIPA